MYLNLISTVRFFQLLDNMTYVSVCSVLSLGPLALLILFALSSPLPSPLSPSAAHLRPAPTASRRRLAGGNWWVINS